MTTQKKYITTFKKLLFAYLALSKIFYWISNITSIGSGGHIRVIWRDALRGKMGKSR